MRHVREWSYVYRIHDEALRSVKLTFKSGTTSLLFGGAWIGAVCQIDGR